MRRYGSTSASAATIQTSNSASLTYSSWSVDPGVVVDQRAQLIDVRDVLVVLDPQRTDDLEPTAVVGQPGERVDRAVEALVRLQEPDRRGT